LNGVEDPYNELNGVVFVTPETAVTVVKLFGKQETEVPGVVVYIT